MCMNSRFNLKRSDFKIFQKFRAEPVVVEAVARGATTPPRFILSSLRAKTNANSSKLDR